MKADHLGLEAYGGGCELLRLLGYAKCIVYGCACSGGAIACCLSLVHSVSRSPFPWGRCYCRGQVEVSQRMADVCRRISSISHGDAIGFAEGRSRFSLSLGIPGDGSGVCGLVQLRVVSQLSI
jgi:hypothetical protein